MSTAASSDLCTACGLCCSGALFGTVPLSPDEQASAARLGLVTEAGGAALSLPCARLEGARCTIYESRPSVCRRYRCTLLRAAESGAVEPAEARARIAKARALADTVRALLPEGVSMTEVRRAWQSRLAAGGRSSPAGDAAARLDLALLALNLYLDRHFREPGQAAVVLSKGAAPPPA